ncbi:hypothetical protein ACLB1M_25430 [Escherichia coli]
MDNEKSFVVADIPGTDPGAAEGAGLGIRFLKYLNVAASCCTSSISIRLTAPIRLKTRIIISELEKYSQDLAAKPRWLVFNKIDLLDKAEAERESESDC